MNLLNYKLDLKPTPPKVLTKRKCMWVSKFILSKMIEIGPASG